MRRILCALFLCLFAAQGSGAAMAAQPGASDARPLLAQVQVDIGAVLARFATTRIGALLTGNASRYDAEHAPPPDFTQVRASHSHPDPDLHPPHAMPVFHPGSLVLTPADRDAAFARPLSLSQPRTQSLRRTQPLNAGRIRLMTVGGSGVATTGLMPWWGYTSGSIPGVGGYEVNEASGNLIESETDVDVPARGGDLLLTRTYNSLSQHDYANTDGSGPSNFGNGWTSNLDRHIAFYNNNQTLSYFDSTGARYDFTMNSSGQWVSPQMQGAYIWGGYGCVNELILKSGVTYGFFSPNYSGASCSSPAYAGYNGRLWKVWGRNYNNGMVMRYYWDNGNTSASNLNEIVALNNDGQSLTLKFADFSGYRELASVTRPDGVQVTYNYDGSGDLVTVVPPPSNGTTSGWHNYGYWSGAAHRLNWVSSPLWTVKQGGQGGYTWFNYNGSGLIISVQLIGWGNFTPGVGDFGPSDGTGTALQPSLPQGVQQLSYTSFSYVNGNEDDVADAVGHVTKYVYDSLGRVTQTSAYLGSAQATWLVTGATYDANNNVTSTTDVRGNVTQYAYDANGNTTQVTLPEVGGVYPTTRFVYDQYSNLLVACDAIYDVTNSTCTAGIGTTHYTWLYSDYNEPNGYLTDIYTPNGYHAYVAHNTANEGGGDYGLPTQVQGDSITQTDGTNRAPIASMTYDSYGNVTSSNDGVGTSTATYDILNRPTSSTDPDGVTSCTWYYNDGSVSASESAAERAASGAGGQCNPSASPDSTASTYTYDADGNTLRSTAHFGSQLGTTTNWYDGADRLVETQEPYDSGTFPNGVPHDYYRTAWSTRYLYDLTEGGSNNTWGQGNSGALAVKAYGNLYDVQEFTGTAPASEVWTDIKGYSYDALDRQTAAYSVVPCTESLSEHATAAPSLCNSSVAATTNIYDVNPQTGVSETGLLEEQNNPDGSSVSYTHTLLGQTASVTYSTQSTPFASYTYDADGRVTSIASAQGTRSYTYDQSGNLTQEKEPQGAPLTMAATLNYAYYPDGSRRALNVYNENTNAPLFGMAYAYRTDGATQWEQFLNGGSVVAAAPVPQTRPHAFELGMLINSLLGGGIARAQGAPPCYPYCGVTPTPTATPKPAPTPVTFSWTYSNGGRMKTSADFSSNPDTSLAYDAYGRVSSESFASRGASITGIQYDDEGEPIGPTGGSTLSYNPRDELLSWSKNLNAGTPSANGYLIQATSSMLYSSSGTADWDARNKVPMGYDYANSQDMNGAPTYQTYTYGGMGLTKSSSYDIYTHPINGTTCTFGSSQNSSYTYDAGGHTTQLQWSTTQYPGGNPQFGQCGSPDVPYTSTNTMNYTWDPIGHPVQDAESSTMKVGATTFNETLHWDGDTLLFTSNASGVIDDIKVGGIADDLLAVNPSEPGVPGLYAIAREAYSGIAIATQQSGFANTSPWNTSANPSCIQGSIFCESRTDGISDGVSTFQGGRIYSGSTNTWTSPDSYQGAVGNPMSAQSYTWNGNNPMMYGDPSGHYSNPAPGVGPPVSGGVDPNSIGPGDITWDWCGATGGCGNTTIAVYSAAAANKLQAPNMVCSVLPGGEISPPGCSMPPQPCHLSQAPMAAVKSYFNLDTLIDAGAAAAAAAKSAKVAAEYSLKAALGFGSKAAIFATLAKAELAAEATAYDGCKNGPKTAGG